MTIVNLLISFISAYQCTKGSHDIIDRMESARNHQQSPLIGRFTDHLKMV